MTARIRDEDLALRAADGDRGAFEELVRRHGRDVWALCRRTLGDPQEADDVAQEALLKAWRGLSGYRPEGRLRSWLLRIAQRASIDALRARKAWTPLPEAGPLDPARPPLALDEREALGAAVDRLNPRLRAVLHARYALGLSGPEIAELLDMTPANVRVCLHRAIHELRGRLT
ncbi:MAG: RNA polymerase sigma factor [Planctomycetota bacterium]